MNGRATSAVLLTAIITIAVVAQAHDARRDDIVSNRPHVVASEWGTCYAKSVPDSLYYSQAGRTTLYAVRAASDTLLVTYPWYAMFLHVHCLAPVALGLDAPSVVRMGPATQGQVARAQDLALAFYRGPTLLRRYSTLDIAGAPTRVRTSESHYAVIDSVVGFRKIGTNRYAFVVRTVDGRELQFDVGTGERVNAR